MRQAQETCPPPVPTHRKGLLPTGKVKMLKMLHDYNCACLIWIFQ